MRLGGRREALILFIGDLVFFVVALWLTLLVRYRGWPSEELFFDHFGPFSFLFLVWAAVFLILDLYRTQTLLFGNELPTRLLRAQIVNSLIALIFFYVMPDWGELSLAPKTNLFLDLVFTFVLVLWWRRALAPRFYRPRPMTVRFDCEGAEVEELKSFIEANPKYRLRLTAHNPQLIVFNRYDLSAPAHFLDSYRLLFKGVQFVSVQDLYEEFFGRVPLSLVNERWFLEQISNRPMLVYDAFKRVIDVVVALVLGGLSLIVYPVVILMIKATDGGPIFFVEERVGRFGRPIRITKFRTMSTEVDLARRRVTRVGKWLRKTRLDELPQLGSVLRGDQSLIGPRPERLEYVELYRERIPFYDARHLIAPGLSGWAQIYHDNHPHFAVAEDATREKLSYDLYYVKHRSPWLDVAIGLKTINTIVSRKGK